MTLRHAQGFDSGQAVRGDFTVANDKAQAKPSPNVKAQMTNEIQMPRRVTVTPTLVLSIQGEEIAALRSQLHGGRGKAVTRDIRY
jgi:hypothetical protein